MESPNPQEIQDPTHDNLNTNTNALNPPDTDQGNRDTIGSTNAHGSESNSRNNANSSNTRLWRRVLGRLTKANEESHELELSRLNNEPSAPEEHQDDILELGQEASLPDGEDETTESLHENEVILEGAHGGQGETTHRNNLLTVPRIEIFAPAEEAGAFQENQHNAFLDSRISGVARDSSFSNEGRNTGAIRKTSTARKPRPTSPTNDTFEVNPSYHWENFDQRQVRFADFESEARRTTPVRSRSFQEWAYQQTHLGNRSASESDLSGLHLIDDLSFSNSSPENPVNDRATNRATSEKEQQGIGDSSTSFNENFVRNFAENLPSTTNPGQQPPYNWTLAPRNDFEENASSATNPGQQPPYNWTSAPENDFETAPSAPNPRQRQPYNWNFAPSSNFAASLNAPPAYTNRKRTTTPGNQRRGNATPANEERRNPRRNAGHPIDETIYSDPSDFGDDITPPPYPGGRQPQGQAPQENVNRENANMDNQNANTQKLMRSAIGAMPSSGKTRGELIKFITMADGEFSTFRGALTNNANLMRVFIKLLTGKLEEPLFTRVTNCTPRSYPEFRKALIKSSNLIRSTNIVEMESKSIFQAPGESALSYLYRVENLISEFMFGLQIEDIPEENKRIRIQLYENSLTSWLKDSLSFPLSVIARSYDFQTIDEFKEFLQREKEREETIQYMTQRTNGSNATTLPNANVFTIGANGFQSHDTNVFQNDNATSEIRELRKKVEEPHREIHASIHFPRFHEHSFTRVKSFHFGFFSVFNFTEKLSLTLFGCL